MNFDEWFSILNIIALIIIQYFIFSLNISNLYINYIII